MNIAGSAVGGANFRARMYAIFLGGIILGGAVLYWRANVILSAEAVDFPIHKERKRPVSALTPVLDDTVDLK